MNASPDFPVSERELGELETPGDLCSRGLLPVSLLRVRKLRRTIRSYAETIEAENKASTGKRTVRLRMWFVTLTYRDGAPWHRSDIRDYLQRVRVWARRHGFKLQYVWCGEMHEKRFLRTGIAKPHYHILLWIPARLSMPQSDKRGWWQKGHTATERAKSVGYLVKYTSKNHVGDGLAFPDGMRIYGAGGLEGDGLALHRHGQKPAWMKSLIPLGEKFKRVSGGVLRCATGEWWQCPYSIVVQRAAGLWCIRCVAIPDERLKWVRADGSTNIAVEAEFTFGVQVWLRWERLEAERREERKALWGESFAYSDGWGCSLTDELPEALN